MLKSLLSVLDLVLGRECFLRYLIWKTNRKSRNYSKVSNNINFAVIYHYQDKFSQREYKALLKRLNSQKYSNFKLIISDDIKSGNLDLSGYSHICFIEQRDQIHPDALSILAERIIDSAPDLIYTDEDELNLLGMRVNPYFKTERAKFMLLSHNYMDAFLCVKNNENVINRLKAGITRESVYKLILDIADKSKISRIPDILYHRSHVNVKSRKKDSMDIPVKEYLDSVAINKAEIKVKDGYNHVSFKSGLNPLISIIIPFKDKVEFTKMCVDSIQDKSTYENYEIILIDNRSVDQKTLKYLENSPHKVVKADFEFNYSRLNNLGVEESKGDYVVLMNNDIEIITPDWMERMFSIAELAEVGIVGPKLLYPNNKIQHVGMVSYEKKGPKHINRLLGSHDCGYRNFNNILREYLMFTGACMMVSRSKYLEVGGLTEELSIISNDTDFSLKLWEKGYLNLYCPDVSMHHHESITRKGKESGVKGANLNFFYKKWGKYYGNDPYFNPNFSPKRRDFAIRITD